VGNTGQGTLKVSQLEMVNPTALIDGGAGPCPDFTVDAASTSALPYLIAPDAGPQTVSFTHHPTVRGGAASCNLLIHSNDPAWQEPLYSVVLQAITYRNCDPVAVASPDGTATFDFPDGGNTLTVNGAASYDPGAGDPLGNFSACAGGQSQGLKQWDWILSSDPSVGETATTLTALPGATSTCKRNGSSGQCVELLVSNSQSPLTAPNATDSSVNLVLDSTFRNHVNLYKLQLKVIDGTGDGGFTSAADSLNLSVQ
jgi:hypothetical protein